jgi:hypothetical protein
MSYGPGSVDADRLGRHLCGPHTQGRKTGRLPVEPTVKVELVINLIVAKALGLSRSRCWAAPTMSSSRPRIAALQWWPLVTRSDSRPRNFAVMHNTPPN